MLLLKNSNFISQRVVCAYTQTVRAGNKYRAINTVHKLTVVSSSKSNQPTVPSELQQLQSILDKAVEEVQVLDPEVSKHFPNHLHGEVACIVEKDKKHSETSLHGEIKTVLIESHLENEIQQDGSTQAVENLARMLADGLGKSKNF